MRIAESLTPPAPLATLPQRHRASRLGHTLLWLPRVDSTNRWMRDWASQGAAEGCVLVADAQDRGRGRHGRAWESPAGLGLYCSLLLRPRLAPSRLGVLTLSAGVAAAEAVRRVTRVPALLRWPNDLMCGGRKLGGILAEGVARRGRQEHVIVGWGLNIGQRRSDFALSLRGRATSLALEGARSQRRETILHAFLVSLERRLMELEAGASDRVLARFEALSPSSSGAALLVQLDGRRRRAISRGLARDGSLRIDLPEGSRQLRTAEVLRILECRPCC
ncbi:MAG: biotin--[acetyl-CoA-carboxylase] ligase [Acidobacteriota bacterium]